jgi:hypothetical protein
MSRLLGSALILAITVSATIFACGGDDGDGNAKVDAQTTMIDAPKVFMDAPAAMGSLGKICTGAGSGDATMCNAAAPQCVTLGGGVFFCTKMCGTSTGSNMPPANGNQTCVMGEMSTGTPVCALYQGSGMMYNWSCAVACGMYMNMNLGTCPTGLTCNGNICR